MDIIFPLMLGIGLSAACGFRVFVPLMVMSAASISGHLTLSNGFEWIGTYPALITFAGATIFEILAYFIPWVDNLLDTIATPTAVIAGTIVSASFISHMDPLMMWTLAAIAGGGSAAVVQTATSFTRLASTTTTGGLGNFVVSGTEAAGAFTLSIVSLFFPIIALGIILLAVYIVVKHFVKKPVNAVYHNQT